MMNEDRYADYLHEIHKWEERGRRIVKEREEFEQKWKCVKLPTHTNDPIVSFRIDEHERELTIQFTNEKNWRHWRIEIEDRYRPYVEEEEEPLTEEEKRTDAIAAEEFSKLPQDAANRIATEAEAKRIADEQWREAHKNENPFA